MKTIKQSLIQKSQKLSKMGIQKMQKASRKEISRAIEKETDVSNHLFYNPLLHQKYNTLEMLEGRKQKYLKMFQAYVLATKDEYQLKTYGEAKKIAVGGNLIQDLTKQIQKKAKKLSSKEAKLFLELKLLNLFFSKYTNQHNGLYMKQYEELICLAQFQGAKQSRISFRKYLMMNKTSQKLRFLGAFCLFLNLIFEMFFDFVQAITFWIIFD